MGSEIYHGTLEGYWEQGWEGRIEYSLFVEGMGHPLFIQSGHRLTIFNDDGSVLWVGTLRFVQRKQSENHTMPTGVWADTKQADVPYAQWIEWFWRKPPLKATLEIEDNMTEATQDHPNINKNVHPPVLMLIHLVIAYVAKWAIPIPLALPGAIRNLGFALVVAGFLLGAAAFVEFYKAHTTLNPHGSVRKLVTSGVYRFSRNPIYLGFVLMLAGFPLFSGTVWGVILVPVMIINMNNLVIQHEEAYLQKKFGDDYARYQSRVRRWV